MRCEIPDIVGVELFFFPFLRIPLSHVYNIVISLWLQHFYVMMIVSRNVYPRPISNPKVSIFVFKCEAKIYNRGYSVQMCYTNITILYSLCSVIVGLLVD